MAPRSLKYQIEVETKSYQISSDGFGFAATSTRRTVITPEIAWHRALTIVRQRGYEFEEARTIAWQEHRKTAISYVYFCMAKERLAKDYPPAFWTLGRLKMLHTRIRNTNKNVEPKRLPGLRWILTTEQTDSQYTSESGLKSPLTMEQVYDKMGSHSIPTGATLENQIIRRLDLKRATSCLALEERYIVLLRSEGLEPDSICRTLSLSRRTYDNLCRSLCADRSAGKLLRERLATYGQEHQGRASLQLRGDLGRMDRKQLYAYEAEWRGNADRSEPTRTNLTRFVMKWRKR